MCEDFDRGILSLAESLFADDDIETLIRGVIGSSIADRSKSAVRVIHRPTGIEAICDSFSTQIQNKAGALLLLRQKINETE